MKKLLVGLLLLGVSTQTVVKAQSQILYTRSEDYLVKLSTKEISVSELTDLIDTIKQVRSNATSIDEILTKTLLEDQDLTALENELETSKKAIAKNLAEEAKAYVEAKRAKAQPATRTLKRKIAIGTAIGTGVAASLAAAPIGYVGIRNLVAKGFNKTDAGLAAAILPSAGLALNYVVKPIVKNVVVKPAKATVSFAKRHPWIASTFATLTGAGVAITGYLLTRGENTEAAPTE